ncbi:MAG: hypothetical protein GC185_02965 [Alphaproteobacteria bacterium]|nr:hypothetical protein [Alphaproteobacteria bacterium]
MKKLLKIFRPFNVFSLLVIVGGFVFAFRLANVLTYRNLPAAQVGAVTPADAQKAQLVNEEPPPLTRKEMKNALDAANDPAIRQALGHPAPQTHEAAGVTGTLLAHNDATAVKPAEAAADNAGGITGSVTTGDAAAAAQAASAPAPANGNASANGGDNAALGGAASDDQPQAFSSAELDVLQSLSKRREELDKREKGIAQREALLAAAEQEVDHKIAELNKLKGEIQNLLGQQQTMENDRIASLVKIYSNMKPKEAAAIFNTLDMNVLLTVISHMNERKSAPIIAAMDPQKARIVTIRLAEQHKLPAAPDDMTMQQGAQP